VPGESIPSLPPLREVIKDWGLDANKRLGQHFLLDLNLTARIARAAGDLSDVTVIEIGPGPGGLTRALLDTDAKQIIAIERDGRCVAALQPLIAASGGRLTVIDADALEVDVAALSPAPRAIIANLPYNVGTPLLIGWLRQASKLNSMILMFQHEVALRLIAAPRSKAYGRLSVITQWLTEATLVFDLPAAAFTPSPKVVSSIVRLTPRVMGENEPRFASMERVIAAAFGQRRKMLRVALKTLVPDPLPLLKAAGIEQTARAEELDIDAFRRLAVMWEKES
jgi:16S rRNA (adenine1518-N6/adenine1519-N6)-dimethyltransferase